MSLPVASCWKQPSTGWQPPFCMRCSSVMPSSNSWLPTLETSRPIAFSVSTAGSSWKTPEVNVEPPIRSPAATVRLVGWPFRSCFRWVARYAAPLASTGRALER